MAIPRNLSKLADGVDTSGTLGVAAGGTNTTATPTAGAIPYGTGTALAYTSAGTTGQVLTSAGSDAPTWSTPSSDYVLISTTNASASSGIVFTNLNSTYYKYIVEYTGVYSAVASGKLYLQMSTDNGSTYFTANAYAWRMIHASTTTVNAAGALTSSDMPIGAYVNGQQASATKSTNGTVELINLASTTTYKTVFFKWFGDEGSGYDATYGSGGGRGNTTTAINAIKIYNSGNTMTGLFKLYGVKA